MKKIIAMAAVLICLLTYVNVNAFKLAFSVPKDGYLVESGDVISSLTSDKLVDVVEVSQNDSIYQRANNLYLNKTSFEFTENYPMILKGQKVLGFFDETSMLIANDFYQIETFESMYLASGISFNEDYTQADDEEFILVRLIDGSYMNTQLIKIETPFEKKYINPNSFINFEEGKITFEYLLEDGTLYKEDFTDLLTANISIGQNRYSYNDFFDYLKEAEVNPDFVIDKEDIDIDEDMPSAKPNTPGQAGLAEDEDGNVDLDKETVNVKELEDGDSSGKKPGESEEGEKGEKGAKEGDHIEENKGDKEGKESSSSDSSKKDDKKDNDKDTPAEQAAKNTEEQDEDESHAEGQNQGGDDNQGDSRLPTVEIGNFTPWVYSAGAQAKIVDHSSRLVGNVKFIATDLSNNKIVARKSASVSGEIVLSTLPPNSDILITASYKFYNDYGEKKETGKEGIPELFRQTIHTLPQSNFTPFVVSYDDSTTLYPKNIKFDNLAINNQGTYDKETLPFAKSKINSIAYISSAQVFCYPLDALGNRGEAKVIQVPSNVLSKLKQGKTIDYQTTSALISNTKYDYEIVFYDKYGNTIPTLPSSIIGSTATDKITPTTSFALVVNAAGDIEMNFFISDPDNAIVKEEDTNSKYRYRIKTEDGQYCLMRGSIVGDTETGSKNGTEFALNDLNMGVALYNLPFNKYLTVEIVADIDLNNNQGLKEDYVIGTFSFFSSGVVTGAINYNPNFVNLGGTYATIELNLTPSSHPRLVQLMTDIDITITSQDKIHSTTQSLSMFDLQEMKFEDGDYQYENGGVTFQLADERTGRPELRLVGDYALFQTNLWDALISGAFSNTTFCKLVITYPIGALNPSTIYELSIRSKIDQGLSYFSMETVIGKGRTSDRQFSTLKREPIVNYSSELINNSIQLKDVYITDEDGTILQEPVILQLVWTENNVIVSTQTMNVEELFEEIRFDDLMDGEEYEIQFVAKPYNNGLTDITWHSEFVFKRITFKANSGINGSLEISELINDPIQLLKEENLYDKSNNLMNGIETYADGYWQYNDTIVSDNFHFRTDFIPLDKSKEMTLYVRGFAGESWYGNHPDGTYHSGKSSNYLIYYNYNPDTDTYKRLGYTSIYHAGWWMDMRTLSYCNDITHVRFSGIRGFEETAELYQGVDAMEIIDLDDYKDYWIDGTAIDGYGVYVADSSYTTVDYKLPVNTGEIYYGWTSSTTSFYKVAFYDESGKTIQTNRYYNGSGYRDYSAFDGEFIVVPDRAASMVVCLNTTNLNDHNYKLYKIADGSDKYHVNVTAKIEDIGNFLPENASFRLESYVNTRELNPENNLTVFAEPEIVEFKNGDDLNEWLYEYQYNLDMDKYYLFKLYLIFSNREILIDTNEVYTYVDWEYIYNYADFDKIFTNPYGNYKVMADITVPQTESVGYRPAVEGTLDFNGHRIYMRPNFRTFDIGPEGVIKNAIVDFSLPGVADATFNYSTFVTYNRGLLENIIIDINRELTVKNTDHQSFLCYQNHNTGTIRNVAILFQRTMIVYPRDDTAERYCSFGVYDNDGLIENCYVTTTNENARLYINYTTSTAKIRFGGIAAYNDTNGTIRNCYSNLTIWQRQGDGITTAGSICNYDAGRIINCFAVGDRQMFNDDGFGKITSAGYKTNDFIPAITHNIPQRVINCYSFTNPSLTYTGTFSDFIEEDMKNLVDASWYTGNLGFVEGEYIIENSLKSGYYPRIILPSNMMKYQPFVKLSNFTSTDTKLRVMNTQVAEQGRDRDGDYAKVKIFIYNPGGLVINDIEVVGIRGSNIENISFDDTNRITTLDVKLNYPEKYVSSYNIDYISYQSGNAVLTLTSEIPIQCEFYQSISTPTEWQSYVVNDPTQNYRLANDIDFSYVTLEKNIYITKTFTGKLDGTVFDERGNATGELYSLINMRVGESGYPCIIYTLRGTVSNLIVDGLLIRERIANTGHAGFVRYIDQKTGILDNVHVKNSEIHGCNYVGGLLGGMDYGHVINCSVTNTEIYDFKPAKANNTLYMGGLVGYSATGSEIINSFVTGIKIDASASKNVGGVGGIVGRMHCSHMYNCYAEGSASNYAKNTGGLIGSSYYNDVINVYTRMRLEGSDVIGGITGFDDARNATDNVSYTNYRNNLVLGDIYAKSSSFYEIHRLYGTANILSVNTYGFAKQIILPIPVEGMNSEDFEAYLDDTYGLLSNAELGVRETFEYKVNLGDQFIYDEVSSRILPKLKNYHTGEVLPEQEDLFLAVEGISATVVSANQVVEDNVQRYVARVRVNHPEGYHADISSVVINGMSILKETGVGITVDVQPKYDVITVKCEKEKAFDNYMFSANVVDDVEGSTFAQQVSATINYGGSVYWDIPNYSYWKEIMREHGYTNENFRITGTIDFAYDTPENYNLLINRLIGTNDNAGFKRMRLIGTKDTGYYSLVGTITSNMSNLFFDDCQMDMTAVTDSSSNMGFVGYVSNVYNVRFNNDIIKYSNYTSCNYFGCIGLLDGNGELIKADNISFNQSTISGRSSITNYIGVIGGITGGLAQSDFSNIYLIGDKAYSNYVGAAIGYNRSSYANYKRYDSYMSEDEENPQPLYTYSFKVSHTEVQGKTYVGGAIGYGNWSQLGTLFRANDNCFVYDTKVRGYSYVGGAEGYGCPSRNKMYVETTDVEGDIYVGGVFGHQSMGTQYDLDAHDLNVRGGYAVGGLAGGFPGYQYGFTVYDVNVAGASCVGGMAGRQNYALLYDGFVDNINVSSFADDEEHPVYNWTEATNNGLTLNGDYVGGVCGYQNANDNCVRTYNSIFTNINVDGCNDYVGGMYGGTRSFYSIRTEFDVNVNGKKYVSAIMGYNFGGTASTRQLQNIFVKGKVKGEDYVAGVAGFVEQNADQHGFWPNTNNDQCFSVVLDISLEAETSDAIVDFFAIAPGDSHTSNTGSINQLRFMNTCEMKVGPEDTFQKISIFTLPTLFAYDDPMTLNQYQPQIVTKDMLTNFFDLFGSRAGTDRLAFNGTYFNYNEDFLVTDNPYEITQVGQGEVQIAGLTPENDYSVKFTYDGNEADDNGLLLYFDAKDNVGTGVVDTTSTVWKNLGSLGSNYDMNIVVNPNPSVKDGVDRYLWEDDSLHIVERRWHSSGEYADLNYGDVYLEADRQKGRINMTQNMEYTMSVTFKHTNSSPSFDLFGFYTPRNNWPELVNYMGPMMYIYSPNVYFQIYAGRWGDSWTGVTCYYNNPAQTVNFGGLPEHYYRNKPIVLTTKYDRFQRSEFHFHYYINGEKVYESGNTIHLGSATNILDTITDGWLHMFCRPTLSKNEAGEEVITYSRHTFSGNVYSARLYDHALSDEQIAQLYRDEVNYYGLVENPVEIPVNTYSTLVTPDENGVVVVGGLANELGNYKGNLKVQVGTKVSSLDHANLSKQMATISLCDATTGEALSGYYFKDKKVIMHVNDSFSKWYRSSYNSYEGEYLDTGSDLYVNMKGYYYAVFSDGRYTPIIHIDNEMTLMQLYKYTDNAYQKGIYVINQEGRKPDGTFNDVYDNIINGGVTFGDFVHEAPKMLARKMKLSLKKIDDELPMAYAYSSGVNTINVDISKETSKDIYVTITAGGKTVLDQKMNGRTITFNYDYKTPFTLTWSDGTKQSYVDYDPINLRNSISTYGDHYYYLTQNNVSSDLGEFDVMSTHIFNDEVLTYDNEIMNLTTSELRSAGNMWSVVETKPLFVFENDDNIIKTFYAYSISGEDSINQQVIVKDGEMYYLTPDMSTESSGFIIGTDKNSSFISSVYEEELIDWGHSIKTPDEFDRLHIRELSCSINSNNPITLIRYVDGTLVGFDYITGRKIDIFSEIEVGFGEYVKNNLKSMFTISRSGALQGSYGFALSQVSVLDESENADVLELFPRPNEEEIDSTLGLTVHGNSVGVVFDKDKEDFVIVNGSSLADGEAITNEKAQGKANKVDNTLQEKIDEIAEKNNIPGLTKGIQRKTNFVVRTSPIISISFILIIVCCLGIVSILVIKKQRSRL